MELRALTRRALSNFLEQCTEPASRRVGKAHARHSGTAGQDSYSASPASTRIPAFHRERIGSGLTEKARL